MQAPYHGTEMKEAIMAYNNQGHAYLLHRQHQGPPNAAGGTYQAKRLAELEHTRTLDVKHREFIVWLNPQGNSEGNDESWGATISRGRIGRRSKRPTTNSG
jgi:hypothetical protein